MKPTWWHMQTPLEMQNPSSSHFPESSFLTLTIMLFDDYRQLHVPIRLMPIRLIGRGPTVDSVLQVSMHIHNDSPRPWMLRDGFLLQWRRCRNSVYPLSHIWVCVHSHWVPLDEEARSVWIRTGSGCLSSTTTAKDTRGNPTVQESVGTQASVISAAQPCSRLSGLMYAIIFPMIGEESFS